MSKGSVWDGVTHILSGKFLLSFYFWFLTVKNYQNNSILFLLLSLELLSLNCDFLVPLSGSASGYGKVVFSSTVQEHVV